MILNYIWIAFFILAFISAVVRMITEGDTTVFNEIISSTFDSANTAFNLCLGLTGVLTLWLGIMKIGENGGVVNIFSRMMSPVFRHLFPGIPEGHPATGTIFMNISANMLGLDNAATPLGLKAMKELQELNKEKDKASDAMIMFLVLNTSGLTIIPISIIMYRSQLGAENPTDVFLPILLATTCSTIAGLAAVCIKQRINLLKKPFVIMLLCLAAIITGMMLAFGNMTKEQINIWSGLISNILLFGVIITFITVAAVKKVNVYESFIEGAKEGFSTAIHIIPYLVAILVGIGVFRASGAMDLLIGGVEHLVGLLHIDTDFVPALPTALMKPLSGSGARGLMVDAMTQYGADSFVGCLASIMQGATDTTFYILAVYFGSVGIKKTRHAVPCGLIADFAGIIAAIIIAYLFFH